MAPTNSLICEISSTDPLQVACEMPGMSWIEILAGLGSAMGTLIAAAAAVFGVYEAFKQRNRADRIEQKNTLRMAGEQYFGSLNEASTATVEDRFTKLGKVFRTLFDFTNLLKDGDEYQKRLAESLNIITGPVINDILSELDASQGDNGGDSIKRKISLRSARSLAETLSEQGQSAFNVVLNVTSPETREERVSFFERRAVSLASQISNRKREEEEKK